jgi:hypothetical protein
MSLPGQLGETTRSTVPFSVIVSPLPAKNAQAWAFQAATAAISSVNPTILRTRLRL